MRELLKEFQAQMGAIFSAEKIPHSFGNDLQALTAAQTEVAIVDRSHWGLLQIKGSDRTRFLHNQSTNNINSLQPGQGCDTVFVNSTGRTLDLVTTYITSEEILLLVSPNRRSFLNQWMDRFIFPMDRVELADLSPEYAIFTLIGPKSHHILSALSLDNLINQPFGSHLLSEITGVSVRVAVGSGLSIPGYTFLIPLTGALTLWQQLTEKGAVPMGDRPWESLRILQGRPMPDHELTEDYNPLEVGLWHTISFDKGCYIGQETIARLNTYKGVKQHLWGIELSHYIQPGTKITLDDQRIGILTSCTELSTGAFGLGYVKSKIGEAGLIVNLEAEKGRLVTIPFVSLQ